MDWKSWCLEEKKQCCRSGSYGRSFSFQKRVGNQEFVVEFAFVEIAERDEFVELAVVGCCCSFVRKSVGMLGYTIHTIVEEMFVRSSENLLVFPIEFGWECFDTFDWMTLVVMC